MNDLGLPGLDDNLPGLRLGLNRRPSLGPPLSGEQKSSMAHDLLERSKGALGSILDVLDLPGSHVRGVLAGKPGTRTTGRQLLNQWGVTRPGDNGWGSWGLGLAADIATDPLTYTTFGAKHALTGGGRALQKAGHLQGWDRRALLEGFHDTESAMLASNKTLGEIGHARDAGRRIATPEMESLYQGATGRALRPGSPLSGLARASIPFRPDLGLTFGSGKLAQRLAGGIDTVLDKARFSKPGVMLGSLFSNPQGRAVDANTARAMVGTHDIKMKLEAQARGHRDEIHSALDKLIRENPGLETPIMRATAIGWENASPLAFLNSARDPAERAVFDELLRKTKAIGDLGHSQQESILKAAHEIGLDLAEHKNAYGLRYMPLQSEEARLAGAGGQYERHAILPTKSGSNVKRKDPLTDLPGGMDRANDWVDRFAGNPDKVGVQDAIYRDLVSDYTHLHGPLTPNVIGDLEAKAREFANFSSKLDADKYLGKIQTHPFYTYDIAGNAERRGMQHARTVRSAHAVLDAMARSAKVYAPGGDMVRINKAFKQLGLVPHDLGSEQIGAYKEFYRKLAPKNAKEVTPFVTGGQPYGINKELLNWGIPAREFENIKKAYGGWVLPEEAVKPRAIIDSFTNSFKALTYPIWIGSHVRNAATAALNNLRTGTGIQDYVKQYKLMRGLLPEAEADALRHAQFSNARIFGEGSPALELVGNTGSARAPSSRQWTDFAPGTNQYGMGQAGPTGSFLGDTANLIGKEGAYDLAANLARKIRHPRAEPGLFAPGGALALSGVGKNVGRGAVDKFAPVVAGRKVGNNIENFFRGAQWNAMKRQGYSDDLAADMIRKFHFDYGAMTPTERNWARRIMPFYTFSRFNLPLQLETLATRPGAFSTPFKPAMVDRDKNEYVPEYLANNFTLPLGPEQEGKRRFLSSLGLPQEEAFKEMSTWNGLPDVTGTLMRYMGNLNPLIKGPLEQMTNTQFYSGRKLSDLRASNTGRTLASLISDEYAQPLSQFVSNTPLTRFATSLDKLMDTKGLSASGRKPGWATALNLLTGARVTDVDLDAQRHFEERAAIERMLSGRPNVSKYVQYYVRPENKANLSPEEQQLLQMQGVLEQRAKEHMKQVRRQPVR